MHNFSWMRMRAMRPTALLFALIATQAQADNLLSNADFDEGIEGWSLSGACPTFYDSVVGSPDRGSLGLNCLNGATETASQCVPVFGAAPLDFSIRWVTNFEIPGAGTPNASYSAYASSNCVGAPLATFTPDVIETAAGNACCNAQWTKASRLEQDMPQATRSVLVRFGVGARDVFVFDHIVLQTSETAKTLQGGLSGTYYAPARSGEGVLVDFGQLNGQPVVFFSWYTYGVRTQQWLVGSNTFDTSQTSITMDVINTSGASFGAAFRPEDVVRTRWGSVTLRFPDCDWMELSYVPLVGAPGTVVMTRALDRLGLARCE